MAFENRISDPDFLTDSAINKVALTGPNVFIDTAARTIRLNNGQSGDPAKNAQTALLDEDGVTLQSLYSFLKQQWKDDPRNKSLIAYPFPLVAITPEQFEFRYGWKMADDSSRDLLRTGGWREYANNNNTLNREYIGVISLGNIDGDPNQSEAGDQDKAYYAFFDSATNLPLEPYATSGPTDFAFPGAVNQAIQTFGTATEGNIDFTKSRLRLFIRQPQKSFDQTDTIDIGINAGDTLPYNTQRFPLVEASDPNVTVTDTVIRSNGGVGQKYDSADGNGPLINYLPTSVLSSTLGYTQDLNSGPYLFGVKIDASNGVSGSLTTQELYSWVHYRLRENKNIEDSAAANKIGKLQDDLVRFVGTTLETLNVTNPDQSGVKSGTAIVDFASGDTNNLKFASDSTSQSLPGVGVPDGLLRNFPFTSTVTLTFSDDILNDSANAKFFTYYSYTREYAGTSITISDRGAAAGDATLDSAKITLAGFINDASNNQDPFVSYEGQGAGIDPAIDARSYIKLNGMSNALNNNAILKVVKDHTGGVFSVNTLDDIDIADEGPTASATLRTHPINSPGAVLIDSAGAVNGPGENLGGVTDTLLPANLVTPAGATRATNFEFTYDFDNNSQYDRTDSASSVAVTVRALGLDNGSWVEATGTIARQDANPIAVISAVERNYSDPV
jgi:hypothetical protein